MQENLNFDKVDFTEEELYSLYENCNFTSCNFSNMLIGKICFENCKFEFCNFSLAKMNNTSFRNAHFNECKMTGINFTSCNNFSTFSFQKSQLQYASFVNMKLQGTHFVECNLQEASFADANLSSSLFQECDLLRTEFLHTNLEKADFTTARNFIINPNNNKIRKARFSKGNLEGLLVMFGIVVEE